MEERFQEAFPGGFTKMPIVVVVVVAYLEETFPKYAKNSLKSSFGDSKIEAQDLQNRVLRP